MKRIFLLLMGLVVLISCSRDDGAPQRSGGQAPEQTRLVSVRLSGNLDLPYDDLDQDGKELSLVPGTKAGDPVLTPMYEEGDQIEAVAYATSIDGTQSSDALPLTLTVGKGGRKFFYHGDLAIPGSMVGHKIRFSVFVGFDPATGKLKAYPTTAPYYAKTGVRQTIKNYPLVLQSKAVIDYHEEDKPGGKAYSYQHLGLRFELVGSLIRCALTNYTDKELTVTGLELHGLGATGLKLASPTSWATKEVFVTSDDTDPNLSFRTYTLPEPKKLAAGAKEGYYLVYAPLVSRADSRGLAYKGYVRPILSDPTHQAEYADGQMPKVLPYRRRGKLVLTNVVMEEKSPIQPNAIPLQYWNNAFYYKPSVGPAKVAQPGGAWGFISTTISTHPSHGQPPIYHFDRATGPARDYDYAPYYINPKDIHADDISRLGPVHVPSKAELDGVFPPDILKEATAQEQDSPEILPPYYQSGSAYEKEVLENIEVTGQRFVCKSSYWCDAIGGSMPNSLMALLYRTANNTENHWGLISPIYALRYSKISPSEEATYKAKGFKRKELATNDRSRVAYMYLDRPTAFVIYACYIGEDPSITTAKDLYEHGIFRRKGSFGRPVEGVYKGNQIYCRYITKLGALYSSPNVNGGGRQRPLNRWDAPVFTSLSSYYPSAIIPLGYEQSLGTSYPSSGLLYRKTSTDNDLVAGWFYRSNEGQIPAPAPVMGWTYDDRTTPTGPINKYLVKDLPKGGDRYFAFPLWLMSDAPSDVPR